MFSLTPTVLVCAGLGAALGRFGQCTSGLCPLTANWKRGAVVGALFGAFLHFAAGGSYQPPKNIKLISEADFDVEVTSAKTPVVVDFYAPWCGPCKILSPRLDEVAGDYTNEVKFVTVNVDTAPSLASRFNVEGIPMVLFFDMDGRIFDASVGLVTKDELRAKLEALARSTTNTPTKLTPATDLSQARPSPAEAAR